MSDLNSPTSAIYTHDNLPVLRGLNSQCVDLIYLDPPFNTGKEWHNPIGEGGGKVGFNDIWGWDRVTGETLEQTIARQWEEERDYAGTAVREVVEAAVAAHSPQMGSYCAWMAPRLLEMRRVLADTGSLYLHCDPAASHYLKALMDAIFGARMFRSEVTWKRTGAHGGALRYGPIHDTILFYVKSEQAKWSNPRLQHSADYLQRHFRHVEPETDRLFQPITLTGSGTRNGESGLPWRGVDPTLAGRHWALPSATLAKLGIEGGTVQERLDALDAAGAIYWPKKADGRPRLKRYADELEGVAPPDVWVDIPPIGARAKERMGYPTQKPIALLERIVAASSNPGDVVLDPFCGCATACIAAQKLGRQWIGIDIEAQAVELCRRRLGNELGFEGITQDLTAAPERNDVRQLELIPRNQKVRLALWQQMQEATKQETPPCPACDRSPGLDYMEVDHIIPRSRGGEHVWTNVQLLCGPCNRSKGNKTWTAWRREVAAR